MRPVAEEERADTDRLRAPSRLARNVAIVHVPAARDAALALAARLDGEQWDFSFVTLTTAAVDRIVASAPDVVLVVYSPGAFGLSRFCRDLSSSVRCRILVVETSPDGAPRVDDDVVVDALDNGADDYVVADTSTAVLAARVRMAIRELPIRLPKQPPLVVGDVLIDTDEHVVLVGRNTVNVRPVQFQLLVMLATHVGSVVSRNDLLERVWGVVPDAVDPRRLRIAISGLRRILGEGPHRPRIDSVPRLGYRLSLPAAAR